MSEPSSKSVETMREVLPKCGNSCERGGPCVCCEAVHRSALALDAQFFEILHASASSVCLECERNSQAVQDPDGANDRFVWCHEVYDCEWQMCEAAELFAFWHGVAEALDE